MSVSSSVQKKLYKDFRKLDSFGLWLEDCGGIYYYGQDPDYSPAQRALTQSRILVENISFDLGEPLNLDRECDISNYYQEDALRINGWDLSFSEKFLYELQIFYAKLILALQISDKPIEKHPRAQLLAGFNHIIYDLIPLDPFLGELESDCKVLRKIELFEDEYRIYYVVDPKIKAVHFLMVM